MLKAALAGASHGCWRGSRADLLGGPIMVGTADEQVGRRGADRYLRNSRIALVVGFGSLLAIMALAGADGLWVLQRIRRNGDEIRRQFLSKNHVLNDLQSELYLSGTYIRDYLLDPDPDRAETYRASLEQVHKDMDAALTSFAGQLEAEEAQESSDLTKELSRYWDMIGPALQWNPEKPRPQAYAFLRDEVFPRRTAMLEVAGRIASLNEQQLNAGNRRVVGLLLQLQTRLAVTLLAALALGLAMSAYSTRKILMLERRAQAQYHEVAEARSQLKDLSARLVQVQEAERRSISRELHDEVGQALSAVLVELRNLSAGLVARSDDQSRGHVERIKAQVENTVRVVRNMALLLRPSMLDDLGLVPALQWQAREVSKRTSMDVSVATERVADDLPDEFKTCIYRVVQEALHNCSRHSNAATVRIRLRQEPTWLTVSIQDDGQGFDARQSKGLGLLGIEERVAQLGGKCRLHSSPGSGTILAVELPFHDQHIRRSMSENETDSHSVG